MTSNDNIVKLNNDEPIHPITYLSYLMLLVGFQKNQNSAVKQHSKSHDACGPPVANGHVFLAAGNSWESQP